jgi:integrase
MARSIGKLSALAVHKAKGKGLYPDGGNLYLQVGPSGAKSWLFRFMLHGRARTMGLGPFHAVSLADARLKAADCRRQLSEGIDPLTKRKAEQTKARLEAARSLTFKACAEAYIEAHKAGWRNAKHIWQWDNSLSLYAYPTLAKLPVQEIDVALVMKVLEPIWTERTETASRLRGRLENILDWATVRGYRQGDNPARWRGHLDNLLPRPSKVQKVEHYSALPYAEIADFMQGLMRQDGLSAKALQLVILTATRTSETIGAQWDEIDLEAGTWTIPANRIKMGREHRVPLSAPAVKILTDLREESGSAFVFPGRQSTKPLSNMALLTLLRRMNRDDITVHGFRSTFRDWTAEQTNYPREVAEAALSHAIEDKVEAAYRRSDLFDKRRQLMDEWAAYCYPPLPRKAGKAKRP